MQKATPAKMGRLELRREAFDGLDHCAFSLQHGNEATVDKLAVHAHGAGAALAFAASLLGAGQAQIFAQHVEKALHGRRIHARSFAVDGEADGCPPCAHKATGSASVSRAASVVKRSSGSSGMALKAMPVASRMALRMA